MNPSLWNGYPQTHFLVDGRAGRIVAPHTIRPGCPWIWRMEFFGAFAQVDEALLGRGFHLAYLNLQNLYGAPVALDAMDRFYDHVTATHGLALKVTLEGFSRGGLFALNWAARHPDRVACLYLDAPVCDIRSWPGGRGRGPGSPEDWARCLQVYGLDEEQTPVYPGNAIDQLRPLAEAHIPILAVYGDADEVVPIEENILILEKQYRDLGGEIEMIAKPGCGHHPHSLDDPTRLADFIASRAARAALP